MRASTDYLKQIKLPKQCAVANGNYKIYTAKMFIVISDVWGWDSVCVEMFMNRESFSLI